MNVSVVLGFPCGSRWCDKRMDKTDIDKFELNSARAD